MRYLIPIILLFLSTLPVQAQRVGGPCEGCEALFEYGNKVLSPTDTLPGFSDSGPKMIVTGTVYQADGETPAENVILYVYHTDQNGRYPTKGDEKGWARRHGYIRGWVKTDKTGRYTFYTHRPASYPNSRIAAHIHITVKEPDKNAYWLDAYEFDDDPYLTQSERKRRRSFGGSGIIQLSKDGQGSLLCERDLFLGLNIPNYR